MDQTIVKVTGLEGSPSAPFKFCGSEQLASRVARWYEYFHTKINNSGIFWRNGMENVGIFHDILKYILYDHLVYFITIWYIL
jgi:hypothetical protein